MNDGVRGLAAVASLVPPAAGGGVVGVMGPDGAHHLAAFGPVEVTDGLRAATTGDRWLLSSVTKAFTALQILALVRDGLLDLQAPLARYVPEFAAAGKTRVTTEHVLTHTSGTSLDANTIERADRTDWTAAHHLEVACAAPLVRAPGSAFEYTSSGYWVLAEAVSRLRGAPYADDLQTTIAGPLGLATTTYLPGTLPGDHVLPVRGRSRGLHHEATRREQYPAGGIVSTASDLLRLGDALVTATDTSLFSSDLVELMRAPRAEGVWLGDEVRWGLGWELGGPGSLRADTTLFSSGGSGTALWISPDEHTAAVLLTAGWALDRPTLAAVGDALWTTVLTGTAR